MTTAVKSKARTDGQAKDKGKQAIRRKRESDSEAVEEAPGRLGEFPNRWHDGFIVHSPNLLAEPVFPMDAISSEQWQAAEALLEQGFVLGFSPGNAGDAAAIGVACALHFREPIVAWYDDGDIMVYIVNEKHAVTQSCHESDEKNDGHTC